MPTIPSCHPAQRPLRSLPNEAKANPPIKTGSPVAFTPLGTVTIRSCTFFQMASARSNRPCPTSASRMTRPTAKNDEGLLRPWGLSQATTFLFRSHCVPNRTHGSSNCIGYTTRTHSSPESGTAAIPSMASRTAERRLFMPNILRFRTRFLLLLLLR